MRVLFHAINGIGLGHVSRVTALAGQVRAVEPEAQILVVTNARETAILDRSGLAVVRVPGHRGEPGFDPEREGRHLPVAAHDALVEAVLRSFRPELLVLDTHFRNALPAVAREIGCRVALVLRKTRAAYLRRLQEGDLWPKLDRILLPHYRSELLFGPDRDAWERLLADPRAGIVGPVVRSFDEPGSEAPREPLLRQVRGPFALLTVGAGGQPGEAEALLQAGAGAAPILARERPGLRLLVVRPPYLRREPFPLPRGASWLPWTPDLPALLPHADAVVAHGGYGSVHEAIRLRCPLVICPSYRKNESQEERAQWCAAMGLAVTPAERSPEAIAAGVCEAIRRAPELRARAAALPLFEPTYAARCLLAGGGPAFNLTLSGPPPRFRAARRHGGRTAAEGEAIGEWLDALPADARLFVTAGSDADPAMLERAARSGRRLCLLRLDASSPPALLRAALPADGRAPETIEIGFPLGDAAPPDLSPLRGRAIRAALVVHPAGLEDAARFTARVEREAAAQGVAVAEWRWLLPPDCRREELGPLLWPIAEERRAAGLPAVLLKPQT